MSPAQNNYLIADDTVLLDQHTTFWRVPKIVSGRTIKTILTNEQLERRGLTITEAAENAVSPAGASLRTSTEQWLVEAPSNDADSPQQAAHEPWLTQVEARLEELKEIASDEGLPHSAESAAAAKAFARGLRRAKRPSVFLVGNGNIRLLWLTAGGEQVGLQFRGKDEVQFVLLRLRGGRLRSTMGADTAEEVLKNLAALGMMHVVDA